MKEEYYTYLMMAAGLFTAIYARAYAWYFSAVNHVSYIYGYFWAVGCMGVITGLVWLWGIKRKQRATKETEGKEGVE